MCTLCLPWNLIVETVCHIGPGLPGADLGPDSGVGDGVGHVERWHFRGAADG